MGVPYERGELVMTAAPLVTFWSVSLVATSLGYQHQPHNHPFSRHTGFWPFKFAI